MGSHKAWSAELRICKLSKSGRESSAMSETKGKGTVMRWKMVEKSERKAKNSKRSQHDVARIGVRSSSSPTHLNFSTSRDKPHDGLIRSLCDEIRLAEQVLAILYFLVSAEDTSSIGV
jgi:hypothetical protein